LDGTSNFSSRIDYFGVSIACFKEGKPFAGLIYRPTTDELYYAEKEKGAFKIKNNKKTKLHIETNDIKTGFLLTNITTDEKIRPQILAQCDRLIGHFKNIRVYGASAVDMCLFADNKCSAILYGQSKIWDIAAGLTIIRESGGEVYDLNGRIREVDIADKFKKYPFFAVHPALLKSFLQKLG
jgi:myo-inositol-1(or 4)-monophosphatase